MTEQRFKTMTKDEIIEALQMRIKALEDLAAEQAEDEGLWFIAETASEAYLQQGLRRLHHAIEGTKPD